MKYIKCCFSFEINRWRDSSYYILELENKVAFDVPGGDTSYRPGPHSATPAVLFGLEGGDLGLDGGHRDARVEGHAPLAGVLGRAGREFALLASVRQRRSNVGTILMITDGDVAR